VDERTAKTEAVPSTQGGWGLFAVLVALLGVLFLRVHGTAEVRVVGLPLVMADPAKLDFGERADGETFAWAMAIRNRSAEPVHVRAFRASCDCVQVEPGQLTIAPRQSAEISLQIRARSRSPATSPGYQVVQIEGYGDDLGGRVLIGRVHGRVVTARP
jgi:hypothetical protein